MTERRLRPHDRLFRLTFGEDLRAAAGELRAVMPPALTGAIDWATLTLADPALLGPDLSERTADLLFHVRLAGRDALLFVVLEHQSAEDPLFVVRTLVYVVRIWERWLRQHPGAVRVPPVVPVLLTHADGGWRTARDLASAIELGDDQLRAVLEPLVPSFRLALVDDLTEVDDTVLDTRAMPSAAKLALAAMRDVRPGRDLVETLRQLDERWLSRLDPSAPADRSAIEAFLSYIPAARPSDDLATITRAVQAVRPSGREVVMATIQELIEARASEARAEGVLAGRRTLLTQLLERRFGHLSDAIRARLASADVALIERWSTRIFEIHTADELLES